MNARKNALLQEYLPRVRIAPPEEDVIDSSKLFGFQPKAIWLEIGFGGGEHLAAQAEKNPGTGYIGCEPFVNGVASLLVHMEDRKLGNVRVFPEDARQLLDALPAKCLDGCFVLYPDPWPKKRHAERRFINAENLDRLARVLKAGAELRLATDVSQLADWMHDQVQGHPDFEIVYDRPEPPGDCVDTRYEKKGVMAGRVPRYLIGRRRGQK
jgi:tRNA (guanine-N7-)-methyltransferase